MDAITRDLIQERNGTSHRSLKKSRDKRTNYIHKQEYELKKTLKHSCTKENMIAVTGLILINVSICAAVSISKPVGLVKISSCKIDLPTCPSDSNMVEQREICMNTYQGCSDGTTYTCGIDTSGRYIIEECQQAQECTPGTTNTFEVDSKTNKASLLCLPCPDDLFETEYTSSATSSIINGCSYKHLPPDDISLYLVIYREGTKSSPAEYQCDAENGYAEEDGNMYCDDLPTKPCNCIVKNCPSDRQLRPDGRCIRCPTKISRKTNFRCHTNDYIWNITTTIAVVSLKTIIPSSTSTQYAPDNFSTTSSPHPEKIITTHPQRENITSTNSRGGEFEIVDTNTGLYIGISVLGTCLVAVAFFVIYLLYTHRKAAGRADNPTDENNVFEKVDLEMGNNNVEYRINAERFVHVTGNPNIILGDHGAIYNNANRNSSQEGDNTGSSVSEYQSENVQDNQQMEELKSLLQENVDDEQTSKKQVYTEDENEHC